MDRNRKEREGAEGKDFPEMAGRPGTGCVHYCTGVLGHALPQLLPRTRVGDVIVIPAVSGGFTSYRNLVQVLETLYRYGLYLRSEAEPWFDFTPENKPDLFRVIRGLYEVQCGFVSRSTARGLHKAKAEGKKLGRPQGTTKASDENIRLAALLYRNNPHMKVREICDLMQCQQRTFYRYLKTNGMGPNRKEAK